MSYSRISLTSLVPVSQLCAVFMWAWASGADATDRHHDQPTEEPVGGWDPGHTGPAEDCPGGTSHFKRSSAAEGAGGEFNKSCLKVLDTVFEAESVHCCDICLPLADCVTSQAARKHKDRAERVNWQVRATTAEGLWRGKTIVSCLVFTFWHWLYITVKDWSYSSPFFSPLSVKEVKKKLSEASAQTCQAEQRWN